MSSLVEKFSNLSNNNILVTGGTGFIGLSLIHKLIELGNNIILVSRYKSNKPLKNCLLIQCDLLDREKLQILLKNIKIDLIVHLAGISSCNENDIIDINNLHNLNANSIGVLYEVAAMKRVKKILMTSSTIVYGKSEKIEIDEDDILLDTSVYGSSKICSEIYARALFNKFKIPIHICRLGHVYGPGDKNIERLVPCIIKAILKDQKPFFKSSLNKKINLLFIDDAISAMLKIINDDEMKSFDIINVNSTTYKTIYDIFSLIKTISKSKVDIGRLEASKKYKPSFISNQKLKNKYNWQENTSLFEGLKSTFNYYKNIK